MSNMMTEGMDRELAPDVHGEIKRTPTPALIELQTEVREAWRHKEAGQSEAQRARSTIESRTDLRLAATNEAMRADPTRSPNTLVMEQETARRWADLDAGDFGRIRSDARRENALDAMAGHMRASPEYADEIKKRSPVIADAARALNEKRDTVERKASVNIDASHRTREALIDAAALAAVASMRKRQTVRVVEQLAASPDTSTQQLLDAQQALKAPPLDGRVTAPNDPDMAAQHTRVIKRPVVEQELTQALLARYIVSHEKRGLLDKGTAHFTFRHGEQQGRVAFRDAGKALSTELEDKGIIRAMVEVAAAKHWKEITVSGSDDFRRNAWIEANLNGMQVHGYEPRDADRKILAELQVSHQTANALTVSDRAPDAASRKHIDGDALTPHEKTVIDSSRTILKSKAMGDQFTESTLRELESKLRGERVYVGEVIDHGKAPYKFDKKNDESYYVTLKTPAGEQVLWGKGLADAMRERQAGEQIVLQNIGKRDVVVNASVRDEKGVVVSVQPKESHLNTWKAELMSQVSERARADFANRSPDLQPELRVYDPKAPRAAAQATEPARTQAQQQPHNPEAQRNGRQR